MNIDRLKALEKAATAGPWETNLSRCEPRRVVSISRKDEHSKPILIPVSDAGVDGEFVAEARNHIKALLKVAEAAKLVKAANARRANALVQDRCERTDYEQSMGYACDQLTRALEELEAQ